MEPLDLYPALALIPALAFALCALRQRRRGQRSGMWLAAIASLAWVGFSAYEAVLSRWAAGQVAPIRVDLLLVGPLLLLLSGLGVVGCLLRPPGRADR